MFDCVGVFVYVYMSVFSMGRRFVCVCLSYSLLLDLVAAAWLSLRDFDLCREIASHVIVGRLVAAIGQ